MAAVLDYRTWGYQSFRESTLVFSLLFYIAVLHIGHSWIDGYLLLGVQETRLAIMGTIQFAGGVHAASAHVVDDFTSVVVPQAKPLSPGEVLGCTSPVIEDRDALVFVADGRFHLEVNSVFV